MTSAVPVQLDLRACEAVPGTTEELRSLWRRLEALLAGRELAAQPVFSLQVDGVGAVGVHVLQPYRVRGPVGPDTEFEIRGVLEPARVLHRCTTCLREGRTTYGPFLCADCGTDGLPGRVCDMHAVVLDLNFARITCHTHVPSCSCRRPATFWCRGPECRWKRAWCDLHRQVHSGEFSYCPACFTRKFPSCENDSCSNVAQLRCRFVNDDHSMCGAPVCPRHATSWKLFGTRQRGLTHCLRHSRLLRCLDQEALMVQIIAGAERRRGRREPELPGLRTIRHIYINSVGKVLRVVDLDRLVEQVRHSPGSRLSEAMCTLVDRAIPERRTAVEAEKEDIVDGERYVARLRTLLADRGHRELAERISFSSYQRVSRQLFVTVPRKLTGEFIGVRGQNVQWLGQQVGVTVRVEDHR
jgi:hypothetical protein